MVLSEPKKIYLRKIWWIAAFLYVVFIYSTLGIAPALWNKLNYFLGGKVILAQYIIYSIIGLLILIYIAFIKKEKSPIKYFLFFLFIGLFFVMIKLAKYPAEKIHIAEYGLLGVFLYNALKMHFNRLSGKLYTYGFILCLIIGALDEVIQWILPNRYFGWYDIFMNGASGMITLLIIRFNIIKTGKIM